MKINDQLNQIKAVFASDIFQFLFFPNLLYRGGQGELEWMPRVNAPIIGLWLSESNY